MSGSLHAWYSLRELETLGNRQAVLRGEIEQRRLPRLAESLHADRGSVKASLEFRQLSGGWLVVEFEYDTTVELTCQRCLEPFEQRLEGRVALALLESERSEAALPEGLEPLELEEGRLQPARLIEDELLVAMPLVPRHANVADCGSLARRLQPAEEVGPAPKAP